MHVLGTIMYVSYWGTSLHTLLQCVFKSLDSAQVFLVLFLPSSVLALFFSTPHHLWAHCYACCFNRYSSLLTLLTISSVIPSLTMSWPCFFDSPFLLVGHMPTGSCWSTNLALLRALELLKVEVSIWWWCLFIHVASTCIQGPSAVRHFKYSLSPLTMSWSSVPNSALLTHSAPPIMA